MQIYVSHVHILCVLWLFFIYYGERIYPKASVLSCKWPTDKSWPAGVTPARIALIADPQIIDAHTYPGRPAILQRVAESVVDYYIRRNWVYINSELDPDANIFVGDLFDGGREWDDAVWSKEFERWNKIFTKPNNKPTVMSLPGNHDIGFGNTIVSNALERFTLHFGDPSSTVEIGNHTIVLLDTISMLNTENSTIFNRPYAFINDLIKRPNFYRDKPRVLLTHVPLYRDTQHWCGPDRESKKPLPYVRGEQFQTQVTPDESNTILKSIQPDVVFSGDDHDACYVLHNYTISQDENSRNDTSPSLIKSAAEYTIKSVSMAMGVRYPAIQLLSLYYDSTAAQSVGSTETKNIPSFATSICYMPNPFKAFISYIIFGFLSCILVLTLNFTSFIFPPIIQTILSRNKPVYTSLPLHGKQLAEFESNTLDHTHSSHPVLPSIKVPTRNRSASSSVISIDDAIYTPRPSKQASSAFEKPELNQSTPSNSQKPYSFSSDSDETSLFLDSSDGKSSTRSLKSKLQWIRMKVGHKQLWKKSLREILLVSISAFSFYMILLYSIYRTSPEGV